MKRRILAVMLTGVLALQGSVWTAAAEEEILLVEDSGGTDLIDEDVPAAEENAENFEGEEILEEDLIEEEISEPEAGEPGTAEVTIEELDVVEDPGYVQVQEEAVAAEAGDVAVNAENFPDEIFREYVRQFDTDSSGILEADEIEAVTDMYILSAEIKDLKGIEFFTSLTSLDCSGNQLSSLNVSGNPALTELICYMNQLSSLDISSNLALTELNCWGNQLDSLDVSSNASLTSLNCSRNRLSNLDVSANASLTDLWCDENQLSSLDVSSNLSLKLLSCDENRLDSLDVSSNVSLTSLGCSKNQLSSLDVSNNTSLESLSCGGNQLSSLDVSANLSLFELSCEGNRLSSLDLSRNSSLFNLSCSGNQLDSLDLSGNPLMLYLYCDGNQLSSLDLSGNPSLLYLYCNGNRLSSLDLSNNLDLGKMYCSSAFQAPAPVQMDGIWQMNLADYVGAGHLDRVTLVTKGASLSGETVLFGSTKPTKLVYQYDTKASSFSGGDSQMEVTLIFSSDTESGVEDAGINAENFPDEVFREYVQQFDKDRNGILEASEIETVTEIAVSVWTSSIDQITDLKGIEVFKFLTRLYCDGNRLSSLDVSGNPGLVYLNCEGNEFLSSLDLSGNPELTYLSCGYNQLKGLDLSKNPELTYLSCSYNQLKGLDLSKNPKLTELDCDGSYFDQLPAPVWADGTWQMNLADYVGKDNLGRVTLVTEGASLSGEMVLFRGEKPMELVYRYDTGASLLSEDDRQMEVTLTFSDEPAGGDVETESVEINAGNFPDEVFRGYVERFDINSDGMLGADEIEAVTEIDIDSYSGLKDLKGVEFFKSLITLSFRDNWVKDIDVSGNPALAYLVCDRNQLSSLDVSHNPNLVILNCGYNELSSLDMSGNPKLTNLYCEYNQLDSLDVSANPLLKCLMCEDNQLGSLDLSSSPDLDYLSCDWNELDSLDVSGNPKLTYLACGNNRLSSLDLSQNQDLKELYCKRGIVQVPAPVQTDGIWQINLADYVGKDNLDRVTLVSKEASLSGETVLFGSKRPVNLIYRYDTKAPLISGNSHQLEVTLVFSGDTESSLKNVKINTENFPDEAFRNYVEGFDRNKSGVLETDEIKKVTNINLYESSAENLKGVEFFKSLTSLYCEISSLKKLDMSGNPLLTYLDCGWSELDSLNVSGNPSLTYLDCGDNRLSSLDISGNPLLTYLDCGLNQLSSLDVSGNPLLTYLSCGDNPLGSLDVSGNSLLSELRCSEDQLSGLDISGNPSLTYLDCGDNQLSSLDVSGNPSLAHLDCESNQLGSLDVSGNPSLTYLDCESNQLGSLDISGNPSLAYLNCKSNQLGSLDVSSNPALADLNCNNNKLSGLNIGRNAALTKLDCSSNQLSSLDLSGNTNLVELQCGNNTLQVSDPVCVDEIWQMNLADYIGKDNLGRVTLSSWDDYRLSGEMVLFGDIRPGNLLYEYDTKAPSLSEYARQMEVLMIFPDVECDVHDMITVVREEPTCGTPGLQCLVCRKCGHEEDLTEIPPTGEHSFGAYVVTKEPTTEEEGIQTRTCTVCGETESVSIPKLESGGGDSGECDVHDMTTVVDQEATCVTPGSQHRECKKCGYKEAPTEIPATGEHSMVTVVDQEATCVTPGSQHRECKKCGYKEAPTEIPATGEHSFGAYVVTKAATVLEEGAQTRTCTVCGETESAPIEKLAPQIEVNAEKITMQTGQTTTNLKVSGLADGDSVVSWESGNKKIVKVGGEGKLTAKKKTGTAVVTITLASGLTKEIQVTVQKAKVATTKISGLPKKVTLKKGEKLTLKPVITPVTSQDKVTYKSSDKKTATVSGKGVVKGKKAGKTKITVTSGKKKATVTVKVKK